MIGLDPNGVPKNKGVLLFASYLSQTFGAVSLTFPLCRDSVTDIQIRPL